ncbi:hypothetical protein V8C86DRAFT_616209 [Haematococcus lacustris]
MHWCFGDPASFANRTEQRSQLSQRASATECKLADTMQAVEGTKGCKDLFHGHQACEPAPGSGSCPGLVSFPKSFTTVVMPAAAHSTPGSPDSPCFPRQCSDAVMSPATPGVHPGTSSATPARLVTPPDRPHTSAGSVELVAQRTLCGGINYKQGDQDLQEGPVSSGRSPSSASTFVSPAPVAPPTAKHSLALSEQQGAEAAGGPSASPRASDEHSTTSQLCQPSVSSVAHTLASPGATPPTPPAALTPAHPTATLDPAVHPPSTFTATSSIAGPGPLHHCHSPGRPSHPSGPLAYKRPPPLQHLQSLRRALSTWACL